MLPIFVIDTSHSYYRKYDYKGNGKIDKLVSITVILAENVWV